MNSIKNVKVLTYKKESPDFEAFSPTGRQDDYLLILFHTKICFSHDGKNYFKVGKNGLIIYSPFHLHAYKSDDEQFINSFMAFKCDKEYIQSFKFPLNYIFNVTDAEAQHIFDILDRISFILNTDYELSERQKIPTMINDLFVFIGNCYANYLSHAESNTKFVLFSNIRESMIKDPINITLKEMVEKSGYTPNYFRIMYKKFFGVNPVKDRNAHLVKVIKDMLETTDFSLDAIAERCGIESAPYLIKLFKSFEKITPHQYRLKSQKGSESKI
jgi:AraC-like DNA-binding protein